MASVLVPESLTATDHGLEIYANNHLVGGIARWNWSQNAKNTRVRAFGTKLVGVGSRKPRRGEPYENVGGNLESVSIQFDRMEIWTDHYAEAWGPGNEMEGGAIQLLNRPMILKSAIQTPEAGKSWSYMFYGARIDSFQQSHDVSGDRVIKGSGVISCQTMDIVAPRSGPFA